MECCVGISTEIPFTPTKDYSPKRQFVKILFHYGVKINY